MSRCLLLLGLLSAVAGALTACSPEPTSLAELERQVGRPGYTLLDSVDTGDWFIAVFHTGNDEIAVGDHPKASVGAWSGLLSIEDGAGSSLLDFSRGSSRQLMHERSIGPLRFTRVDGTLYPIRPGYSGPIRVKLVANLGGGARTVYDIRLAIPPPAGSAPAGADGGRGPSTAEHAD